MEAFLKEGESEDGSEVVEKKVKGKGVETETPSKEEKEEKVDFKSGVKWEAGSLFGTPAPKGESKADLSWVVGLGKLKEVEMGDMGYYNKCRKMGEMIGGRCKKCKGPLV